MVCIGLYFYAKPFVLLVCGNQYIEAVPIFRAMLPSVVITLPVYLFGYPVLGALNKINIANKSVIIASLIHAVGLFFLFISKNLGFIQIVLLTLFTDCIVLSIRVFYVIYLKYAKTLRVRKHE
jgi:PST family polysaccharide transporter